MTDKSLANPEVAADGTVYNLFNDKGSFYYVLYGTEQGTTTHRWRVNKSDDGKVYFVNAATRASAWKLPGVDPNDRPVDIAKMPLTTAIEAFYQRYNPDKASKATNIVAQYMDKQDTLFKDLYKNYNPEGYPLEAELFLFYANHATEKINNVPQIAKEWKGREIELWKNLNHRYGVAEKLGEEEGEEEEEEEEDLVSISEEHQNRLQKFYKLTAPEKITEIPTILQHYHGKEEDLMQMLVDRYPQHKLILQPKLQQQQQKQAPPKEEKKIPEPVAEVTKKLPPSPLKPVKEAPSPVTKIQQRNDPNASMARDLERLRAENQILREQQTPEGKSLDIAKSRLKESRTAVDVAQQMVAVSQQDAERAHLELQRSREREKDLLNGMAILRKNAKETELLLTDRINVLEKQLLTLRATETAAASCKNDTLFRLQQDLSLARYADLPRGHPTLTDIDVPVEKHEEFPPILPPPVLHDEVGVQTEPVGTADAGVQKNVEEMKNRESYVELPDEHTGQVAFDWKQKKHPQLHLISASVSDMSTQTDLNQVLPKLQHIMKRVEAGAVVRRTIQMEINALSGIVEKQAARLAILQPLHGEVVAFKTPTAAVAAVLYLVATSTPFRAPTPPVQTSVLGSHDAQHLMAELGRLELLSKRVQSKSPNNMNTDYRKAAMNYIRERGGKK
eukprot:TRINITY_DN1897_c0_g4_i1.p1 TRINITY_DN1897_c0_g4~~TRINITY_DN1897_c0_g4_i1.p1  ORF type:complete len:698 (+),score=161.92 TRINITY_DN1897_c0_g4_i1:67-2094(+)